MTVTPSCPQDAGGGIHRTHPVRVRSSHAAHRQGHGWFRNAAPYPKRRVSASSTLASSAEPESRHARTPCASGGLGSLLDTGTASPLIDADVAPVENAMPRCLPPECATRSRAHRLSARYRRQRARGSDRSGSVIGMGHPQRGVRPQSEPAEWGREKGLSGAATVKNSGSSLRLVRSVTRRNGGVDDAE